MKDKTKLYVPFNISLRREWFKGFGDKELVITGVSLVLNIVLAIVLSTVFSINTFVVMLLAMGLVSVTVILIQKTDNMSLVDYIKISINFHKEQQQFDYVYKESFKSYGKTNET